MKKVISSIDCIIEKIASWGLYFSVAMMIVFSVLTIVLRWINYNVSWFDPFVRHLVFLSTFLGGVLATGRKTHIGIDILGKYADSKDMLKLTENITRIISLACIFTLLWLTKSSIDFLLVEAKYGKAQFLGIHSKFLVGIIPFGFSLLSLRFTTLFILSFYKESK